MYECELRNMHSMFDLILEHLNKSIWYLKLQRKNKNKNTIFFTYKYEQQKIPTLRFQA